MIYYCSIILGALRAFTFGQMFPICQICVYFGRPPAIWLVTVSSKRKRVIRNFAMWCLSSATVPPESRSFQEPCHTQQSEGLPVTVSSLKVPTDNLWRRKSWGAIMKWKYGWIVLKMGKSFVSPGHFYLTFAFPGSIVQCWETNSCKWQGEKIPRITRTSFLLGFCRLVVLPSARWTLVPFHFCWR